ncbi:hypothetical protein LQV63_10695 [Paenibacillus profundus]|uniref:Uncharacterized protein n=1 Tax=Paenibacillus profundus TaxID=1173085 RepID=A0ABS8YCN2_9BACL|nr:hypothetical protein [Paenibacillus profundus]MCE5169781.1 hypothetical protein [Paenibacillus profundus]
MGVDAVSNYWMNSNETDGKVTCDAVSLEKIQWMKPFYIGAAGDHLYWDGLLLHAWKFGETCCSSAGVRDQIELTQMYEGGFARSFWIKFKLREKKSSGYCTFDMIMIIIIVMI